MNSSQLALQTKFQIRFRIFGRKQEIFQMNSEAWILIDQIAMCMYQWICVNELYKLMESFFFQISNSFLIFDRKPKILAENQKIFLRIARREYWSSCNLLHVNEFTLTSSTN